MPCKGCCTSFSIPISASASSGSLVVIAVVIYISKQSYQIAKFLGYTLVVGGFLVAAGGAWGFVTSTDLIWIGLAGLGLIATLSGRGILDSYGKEPLQAGQQQPEMPIPLPVSPHTNVGNASTAAINEHFGGAKRPGKLDNQKTAD